MGKTIVVYEGGEALRFDEFSIEEAIRGVRRLLKHYGMIKEAPKTRKSVLITKSHWIRASVSGMFRPLKVSGQSVKQGEIIGVLNEPANRHEEAVLADDDGYLIGHNNIPVVHKGDALFHIGQP